MKIWLAIFAVVILSAADARTEVADGQPPVRDVASDASSAPLPGIELAGTVSEITGVAISPVLGVSAVGAWRYWRAPAEERSNLPWFCHPAVWGLGLALVGVTFLKDVLGTGAPPLVKKPLDVAELFESKLGALIASAAFVPIVVTQFTEAFQAGGPAPSATAMAVAGSPEAMIAAISVPVANIPLDARIVLLPLFLAAFLLVWLSTHAINVLIALSPFGLVDAALKLFKAFLLGSVLVSAVINPYFGAFVSLSIIVLAILVAPWAFRLTVFGTVFGLDVLLPWLGRRKATESEPHAFLARKISRAPSRTYGRLRRTESGLLCLVYRPFLVLPARELELPADSVAVTKGLLYPTLAQRDEQRGRFRSVLMILPRYRGREEALAAALGIADVRDSTLIRGFKAMRAWLGEMLSSGRKSLSGGMQATPATQTLEP